MYLFCFPSLALAGEGNLGRTGPGGVRVSKSAELLAFGGSNLKRQGRGCSIQAGGQATS